MSTFFNVILNHFIIAFTVTVLLWLIGAVISTDLNFFQWDISARLFIVLLSNLSAVIIQSGLNENELI